MKFLPEVLCFHAKFKRKRKKFEPADFRFHATLLFAVRDSVVCVVASEESRRAEVLTSICDCFQSSWLVSKQM
jgi:DNA-binding FadR family transcriptional regulator